MSADGTILDFRGLYILSVRTSADEPDTAFA